MGDVESLAPLMEAKRVEIRAARTPISGPPAHERIMCGESIDCTVTTAAK